jgi:acyl carrier protein
MALTKETLLGYLQKKLRVDVSKIGDTTELFSTGVIDSFAMVDLLVFLEKQTGSKLGPEHITVENFDSVQRILDFAAAHTKA